MADGAQHGGGGRLPVGMVFQVCPAVVLEVKKAIISSSIQLAGRDGDEGA